MIKYLDSGINWPDFPHGSVVKKPPSMREMQVWSLGQKDPLEEGMATHSSILAQPEEPGGLQSTGSQKKSDKTEWLSTAHSTGRERNCLNFLRESPKNHS